MRDIKFRVWDGVMKDWIPFGLNEISDLVFLKGSDVRGGFIVDTFDSEAGRYILMQYTGLKDKNDKEIYEGDIVKYVLCGIWMNPYSGKNYFVNHKDPSGTVIGKVYWDNHDLQWSVESRWIEDPYYKENFENPEEKPLWKFNGIMPINVYENPELLRED